MTSHNENVRSINVLVRHFLWLGDVKLVFEGFLYTLVIALFNELSFKIFRNGTLFLEDCFWDFLIVNLML